MSDPFVFQDGQVWLWTGTASGTHPIGFVRAARVTLERGWESRPALDGQYHTHATGQRADVRLALTLTPDSPLWRLEAGATAVHAHIAHSGSGGSAGCWLWSGHLDRVRLTDRPGAEPGAALVAHFHQWSAYGG